MTVEFNTGFVAEGPLTVGFETRAANLKYGVNVQGTQVGILGDGGTGFSDPREGTPGAGVFGIGNSFGVLGNGNRHNRDSGIEAIAGVFGESNHGSSGVIGVVAQLVQGRTDQGSGVVGLSMDSIGSELSYRPLPQATGKGIGVFGASGSGPGVRGESATGIGVFGFGTGGGSVGVEGNTAFGAGTGVHGHTSTGVAGVHGTSDGSAPAGRFEGQNFGVVGMGSAAGVGVAGNTAFGAGTGVHGHTSTGVGVLGTSDRSGLAGHFRGNVTIEGALRVIGGAKNAVVAHPDGSYKQLYCMESPESWFEDFGESQLVDGQAEVRLDPNFAALVEVNGYHVFLSPYGESNGMFVAKRQATGFRVCEQRGGTGSASFGYRVVAKRKDIVVDRLATVAPPQLSDRKLGVDLRD